MRIRKYTNTKDRVLFTVYIMSNTRIIINFANILFTINKSK